MKISNKLKKLGQNLLFSITGVFILITPTFAEPETAFLPTWKLMKFEEKQHFISGYIQGWIDAARVTDIAIAYVRENPTRAVEGLQSVQRLYDLSAIKPQPLVEEIDAFFAKPVNSNASLSAAVTAARSSVTQKLNLTAQDNLPK